MTKADGQIIIDTRIDTKGITTGAHDIQSKLNGVMGTVKKLGMAIAAAFAVKQLISFGKECIALGSDLDEVQNVLDVTFGKMSGVIDQFAKDAISSFGLSELSAKQYTSTIGAMLKSMGFTGDAVTEMSIKMAELTGDMASFYNQDTDTAFQKIRSGISGETEPLKQLGINLSEANLEQFRLNQGMTTAYKNLSQQEKALLRYNYLLSVTSDAQGDFARTSGSWANQLRVVKLRLDSIKADLGKGFINLFTPVLRVINTVIAGIAKMASAFKAFTALITGQKADTSTNTGAALPDYGEATEGAEDYADAVDDTTKATKAAQKQNEKYLSGLDQIKRFNENNADDTTGGGSGSKTPSTAGGGASTGGIDFGTLSQGETVIDKTAKKMKELYDAILEKAQPAIDALKRLWNEGLSQLGKFTFQNLKNFIDQVLVPVGSWVLGTGIPRFVDALNNGLMKINYDKLTKAFSDLYDAIAPFAINVGEGLLWFWENVLVPLGTWTANEILPRFLGTVTRLIQIADAILTAAKPGFEWFWNNLLLPIAKWTGGVFTAVWDKINDALGKFAQWCKDNPQVIENVTTFVSAFFTALAGISVVMKVWTMITSIGKLVGAISTIVGALNPVTIAIAAAIAFGVLLYKNWDTIKAKAEEIWGRIKAYFLVTWELIKKWAVEKFEHARDAIIATWEMIKTKAIEIWDTVSAKVSTVFSNIKNWAETKFEAAKTAIVGTWESIKTSAIEIWDTVSAKVSTVFGNIQRWASEKFEAAKTSISTAWGAVQTKTIEVWDTVSAKVSTVFGNVKRWAAEKFDAARVSIINAWDAVKRNTKNAWETGKQTIGDILSTAWTSITEGVDKVFPGARKTIIDAWDSVKRTTKNIWTTGKNTIGSILSGAWDSITTNVEAVGTAIHDAFWNAFDGLAELLKTPINALLRVINGMIGSINELLGGIESAFTFTVYDGAGGTADFWLTLPRISEIPYLAKGAVIPPNAPFIAALGDQKHGTNIEAPLETIKQAVQEVNGGGETHINLYLDGKIVYETVVDQAKRQQQMSGLNPFAFE